MIHPVRVCGEELEQPSTGRPKAYCGEDCRRFAEGQRRQLHALIGFIDERLIDARIVALSWDDEPKSMPMQKVLLLENQKREAEGRLNDLLGVSPRDPKTLQSVETFSELGRVSDDEGWAPW